MQRTHRYVHSWLITAAILIPFARAGVAEIGTQQQTPGTAAASSVRITSNATDTTIRSRNAAMATVPEDFAKLKLAPGFLLSLNVLEDSDFSGNYRIDELGDLVLPVLGKMHVGGETASEAGAQIEKKLVDDEILKHPQVTVSVLEYTQPEVTMIGEVASPGKYPLLTPRKLVEVLALAGGLTPLAGYEVEITSKDAATAPLVVHYSKATDPKTVENVIVNPGDTVRVKRAGIVYVLGGVMRPGGYVMQEEGTLSVLQAISLANGTSIPASVGTIYVLRRNADGTEVDIAVPYNKMAHGKRSDVILHAMDVVYVPTSKVKSILTYSQGILGAATSSSIYAATTF